MHLDDLLNLPSRKIKYGLGRTKNLLKKCHNPEKFFFKIQVVGTNGKGTVSAFLTKALSDAGYKVGTYTSPHLLKANERIQINLQPISNHDLNSFVNNYKKELNQIKPSFFEIMTVAALWYFKKEKVDIAILETGLGGRLDSVSACNNDLLLYTTISMDHHKTLGNKLIHIAQEKAQAINKKKQTIIALQQPKSTINKILKKQAKLYNNKISFIKKSDYIQTAFKHLYGKHQIQNASLAFYGLRTLHKTKIINISKKQILKSLYNTSWKGRFQIICNSPLIIYDVAHNKESLDSFLYSFLLYQKKKKYQKKYLICAFEDNKKIKSSLIRYIKYFDCIVCSQTNIRKSMPAVKLASLFLNKSKTSTSSNIGDAIYQIKNKARLQDIIVILGSHYIAPYLDKNFKNCFADNK